MSTPATDNWDSLRQAFAAQFEPFGTSFVYRRSQKGEAISVSPQERDEFIERFDTDIRRCKWLIYLGFALVIVGTFAFTFFRNGELNEAWMFVAMLLAIVPYAVYYRRAWSAPARQLAGRTPVAGERPREDVLRLKFQRISYGRLATAGFGGLALPFIGSRHADVFSGWDRLWLVFGAGLILLVAVQAFRKWRFESQDAYRKIAPPPIPADLTERASDSTKATFKAQIWRYVPFAIVTGGLAFIGFTQAGKQLANTPRFWPLVSLAVGGWALATVARGIANGRIQPFVRGFYNTYERENQPKRYWASMVWNALFGCGMIVLAYQVNKDATAQPIRERCYNKGRKFPAQDMLSACNDLLAGKASLGQWSRADIYVNRGIANAALDRQQSAILDYTTALRLQADYSEAYYDRALAYSQIGDAAHALSDYGNAIRLNPRDPDPYFDRGLAYLGMQKFDQAISDFTRAHDLNPKDVWPLANRGLAWAWEKNEPKAEADFASVRSVDPSNPVMLRGEALRRRNLGDDSGAVDFLTASMKRDPDNIWALRARAELYWELGEQEKSAEDDRRYRQLIQSARAKHSQN